MRSPNCVEERCSCTVAPNKHTHRNTHTQRFTQYKLWACGSSRSSAPSFCLWSLCLLVIINYFCVIYGNVQSWWIDCSNVALNLCTWLGVRSLRLLRCCSCSGIAHGHSSKQSRLSLWRSLRLWQRLVLRPRHGQVQLLQCTAASESAPTSASDLSLRSPTKSWPSLAGSNV